MTTFQMTGVIAGLKMSICGKQHKQKRKTLKISSKIIKMPKTEINVKKIDFDELKWHGKWPASTCINVC